MAALLDAPSVVQVMPGEHPCLNGSGFDDSIQSQLDHALKHRQGHGGWELKLNEADDRITAILLSPAGHSHHRSFSSPSCEDAGDQILAFVLAILDPLGEYHPPSDETAIQLESSSRQLNAALRRTTIALRLAIGVDGGALPGAGAILDGTLSWLGRRWRIELGARGRLPVERRAELDPAVGGRLSLWALSVKGCGVPHIDKWRLEFPLCVGFEAGQIRGRGVNLHPSQSTSIPWGALLLSPAIAFRPARRWAIMLIGEGGLAANRADLNIDGLETLHRIGFGFGRASLSVELRFW